jgi:F-type H+-transporting ATPase subunit c
MKRFAFFLVMAVILLAAVSPALASTEEGAAVAGSAQRDIGKFMAAALVLGLAAFAGAFGQARTIAAACTSMGRNPGAAGPVRITMIIGVAFIESLVIYALLIAFIILGK